MREIKFRVWDIRAKCFENEVCIGKANGADSYIHYLGIGETKTIDNNVKILQYTGLKDKNGVEIYEGDIIKYDFNGFYYRMEFVNAEFIGRRFYKDIENLYPTEFDYGLECEVIGNIYENKELLEG